MQNDYDFITARSGKYFPFSNPTADDINPLDIASGLSKICRFGGQCRMHYSVAQHSLALADMVKEQPVLRLYALLHDAAEAYIGDLPRPIKHQLPQFMELEQRIMAAVWDWAKLPPELPAEIKYMDTNCVRVEAMHLFNPVPKWVYDYEHLPDYPGKYFVWKPHSYWEMKYINELAHAVGDYRRYCGGDA